MINIWYSHGNAYHKFASVPEVADWIGTAENPSIIAAEQLDSTLRIVIGSPTKCKAEVTEFTNDGIVDHGAGDRATGIRIFLRRLAELYDS